MVSWPDDFETPPQAPSGEGYTKFGQGRSEAFDNHFTHCIQEYEVQGGPYLRRKLMDIVGPDEAEAILQEGLEKLWEGRYEVFAKHQGPDPFGPKDVGCWLMVVCERCAWKMQRKRQRIAAITLRWWSGHQGEMEEEARSWDVLPDPGPDGNVEETVCNRMHDRDIMRLVYRHFPKEVDRRCIEYMMDGMEPREMATYLPGSVGSITVRCFRVRKRLRGLSRQGILPKEFDFDGG